MSASPAFVSLPWLPYQTLTEWRDHKWTERTLEDIKTPLRVLGAGNSGRPWSMGRLSIAPRGSPKLLDDVICHSLSSLTAYQLLFPAAICSTLGKAWLTVAGEFVRVTCSLTPLQFFILFIGASSFWLAQALWLTAAAGDQHFFTTYLFVTGPVCQLSIASPSTRLLWTASSSEEELLFPVAERAAPVCLEERGEWRCLEFVCKFSSALASSFYLSFWIFVFCWVFWILQQ